METNNQTKILDGKRILVVEDEALIAMELEYLIEDAGGIVVGPCQSLNEAQETIGSTPIDGAVLDVMLGREEVFPAAMELKTRGVGFIFHSGHVDPNHLKEKFPGIPLCTKPSPPHTIVKVLSDVIT